MIDAVYYLFPNDLYCYGQHEYICDDKMGLWPLQEAAASRTQSPAFLEPAVFTVILPTSAGSGSDDQYHTDILCLGWGGSDMDLTQTVNQNDIVIYRQIFSVHLLLHW